MKKIHFFMRKDNFINQMCIGGSPTFRRNPNTNSRGVHNSPTKLRTIKYACIIKYLIARKGGIKIVKIHDNVSKYTSIRIKEFLPIKKASINK
jgi:hypothetical protein